ncbi:MAG TPA: ribonucleoside-diphosphate reductase subunit alpha [Candidatus Krumholzibacteria bacterium]|nr:ribonucleoside-diphosphate reductase subunit alpha [Candidatus Krumholzibacteria bacterium]
MEITKVKKRNGAVVDFDRHRIERAIEKACVATAVSVSSEFYSSVTDDVTGIIERKFDERIPGVEDIQDVVEMMLAERGLFEVAKAYILYRAQRQDVRKSKQDELLEKIDRREIKVVKRSGEVAEFNIGEIEKAITNCCQDLEGEIDVIGVLRDTKLGLYDGIKTSEINQAVIMAIRARIERDPVYSTLAARFLFNDLYKHVLGMDEFAPEFAAAHTAGFATKIQAGVDAGRLDARLLEFDLTRLGSELRPERDRLFTYLGAQVLYDRYFLKNLKQDILETPQYFWMRIAMGLALNESSQREDWALKFYDVISSLHYVPSTPTLFHSGTQHPQMSSCYLTTVKDDLSHILKSIGDNAQLSKWSGGLGNDWTSIRGTGAQIKSTNVGSQGVVPFLKIVDATTAAINRSGKRRGATCVYLECWHYDFEDFLELRKNTGDERRRTHDTNTASWIPDLFMKRVLEDGAWTMLSPDEAPDLHDLYGAAFEKRYLEYEQMVAAGEIRLFRTVRALDLWRRMITMLYETGHPWITFKDPCNVRSPQDHVGVVHSSNLCTEITLNTSVDETAVCNLGSINLGRHIDDGVLNQERMKYTIKMAVRMLDNVIDLNFYPTVESQHANLRHRPIGLGIMGIQDALYMLNLPFDSEAAVKFSDELQELISYHAILSSSELAKEKGAYQTFKGSKWDRGIFPVDTLALLEKERGMSTGVDFRSHLDWTPVREHVKQHGMRNSNTMAIAPTATIANIAGCVPSIEPIYKNMYVKSNFSGEFTIINRFLVSDLKELGLWDEDMMERVKYHDGSVQKIDDIPAEVRARYKEVFEIDTIWIVKHAAQRGKWIDQSQSVNIFTTSTSGKQISDSYMAAWKMGLKTTYYLRTLGASSIEKSTLDSKAKKFGAGSARVAESMEEVPASQVKSACSIMDPTCEACQ